ncbi:tRNA lysidine(34) synthetase TilS [Shigella flexneri]
MIKSVTGQAKTLCRGRHGFNRWNYRRGWGSVQLTAGVDIRPPRADEAVSVRFKAPGLLHIVGRNGGRKLKKIWQELACRRGYATPRHCCLWRNADCGGGVFVTQEGVAEGEKGVSFVWQKTLVK